MSTKTRPAKGLGLTAQTRPKRLTDVVGLDNLKSVLETTIAGCKARNQPLPSLIITGPAGAGKTTIGRLTASLTGGKLHIYGGSDIAKDKDIYAIVDVVTHGDVVLIDEAHTMGGSGNKAKHLQSVMHDWIEDGTIRGERAPQVCFIFCTTNPGKITPALRSRCLLLNTSYYSVAELSQILLQAGKKVKLDMSSSPEGLLLLAKASRGVPRVAIMQRLESLLNFMAAKKIGEFTIDVVKEFFSAFGLDASGLETNDRKYLEALYQKMLDQRGRGASLLTMSQSTGFAEDMVKQQIEGYLIQEGFISITGQGRILTRKGYEAIGKTPISDKVVREAQKLSIDKDFVRAYCQTVSQQPKTGKRDIGLRPLMDKLPGTNYMLAEDRDLVRGILKELGYESKQRSGIVPIMKDPSCELETSPDNSLAV